MADLRNLADCFQLWGNDLTLSPTGDLATATIVDRSQQRVLRRLCTNRGDYISHLEYGGGLPQRIGTLLDVAKTRAQIRGQMLLEASVAKAPAPAIAVQAIPNGVAAQINYIVKPGNVPAVLSFSLSE